MPSYTLPMRWADLDQLNHVNNVVYLRYAAEARAALVDDGGLDPDLRVGRIGIDFSRPMPLSRRPVVVEQHLERREGATPVLTQEVTRRPAAPGTDPTVFAQLETTFVPRAEPIDLGVPQVDAEPFAFRGRRGDVALDGFVDEVRVFEYFQESRIISLAEAFSSGDFGNIVVAHLGVDYGQPVPWQSEPWEMALEVSRVGNRSFTLVGEWRAGDTVLARCRHVVVTFDVEAQAARDMTAAERAYLTSRSEG